MQFFSVLLKKYRQKLICHTVAIHSSLTYVILPGFELLSAQ